MLSSDTASPSHAPYQKCATQINSPATPHLHPLHPVPNALYSNAQQQLYISIPHTPYQKCATHISSPATPRLHPTHPIRNVLHIKLTCNTTSPSHAPSHERAKGAWCVVCHSQTGLYTRVCLHVCRYMYIYIYIYMCVCIHVCVHVCVYCSAYVCAFVCVTYILAYVPSMTTHTISLCV